MNTQHVTKYSACVPDFCEQVASVESRTPNVHNVSILYDNSTHSTFNALNLDVNRREYPTIMSLKYDDIVSTVSFDLHVSGP